MIILPAAYLPSIRYVACIASGDCVIDIGEHFVKRSERNRALILAPDGVMPLTVHVAHADRPRTPVRDIRLDYSKRWQHLHWRALMSYYRSSPYFDHYAPRLERFYTHRWDWLTDYDIELTSVLLGCLGLPMPRVSDSYIAATDGDTDLRPKGASFAPFREVPYVQVFADRQPFAGGLSFADLLFCEGPGSKDVLRGSLR